MTYVVLTYPGINGGEYMLLPFYTRQYDILEGVRGRYAISSVGDCYL